MSKELNKAPVEQAGGDEREEFEAWMHTFDLPPQLDGETFADERYLEAACFGQFVYDDPLTQRCWAAWQARAALAQPSPKCATCNDRGHVCLDWEAGAWEKCPDCAQAEVKLDFSRPLETENGEPVKWICADVIEYKSARVCVAKDTGLVYSSPYIGLKIRNVIPEQAEAERPEVVARVVHSNPVVLDHCAPLNANDELMTIAQHAASVARWAEMFNRVEQERDAALARVAELDKQCRDDVARALGLRPSQERGFAWSYLLASIKSCVKASEDAAQAQHSVPDGYRLVRLEHFAAIKAQLDPEQVDAYRGRNIYDEDKVYANWNKCRSALDEIKDVFQQIDWDAENELAELLAAAPGKEVGHE
ncbi:hypothetical protein KKY53_14770 [Pseudomonas aeruginosa]|uniref:hypothetical protein n=1 Tax=Pseudomonas aeruginosa TaxID=287 RepID=UPI002298E756|nr:hypothetical protein KKY53_14770 [Pseudomonas aeruginosa]HBO0862809.1 hypothetical protein [Pseudomonas aeruginosa]HBO5217502.1 hypothetical protein [Pseudomonas aeruginosa]HCE6879988.1 hypothetical protein [Pseudomonas aeruginosa]HCT4782947.1 hypothetical protein [Pseudomonas aeruginosa]